MAELPTRAGRPPGSSRHGRGQLCTEQLRVLTPTVHAAGCRVLGWCRTSVLDTQASKFSPVTLPADRLAPVFPVPGSESSGSSRELQCLKPKYSALSGMFRTMQNVWWTGDGFFHF